MKEINQNFSYREYDDADELDVEEKKLLEHAKAAITTAYAPYSKFKVGAAALLENGKIISGSNQENASSPAGICAERVTLSAASAVYPDVPVKSLAITVKSNNSPASTPVAPCGICRQTLLEYEQRFKQNIVILLQGEQGKIYRIDSAKDLLPLYFSGEDLGSVSV